MKWRARPILPTPKPYMECSTGPSVDLRQTPTYISQTWMNTENFLQYFKEKYIAYDICENRKKQYTQQFLYVQPWAEMRGLGGLAPSSIQMPPTQKNVNLFNISKLLLWKVPWFWLMYTHQKKISLDFRLCVKHFVWYKTHVKYNNILI